MITNYTQSALNVLDIEQRAIQHIKQFIDDNFTRACQLIQERKGKVIVTGMGKSGHIGKKVAATLASTGTPSFFMHPGEANHGDLGMLEANDVILAMSNSGETEEVIGLLPVIKRLDVPMIAFTGNPKSTLAIHANVHVCIAVEEEACPLGLAPTASTTATLAMGDALAVALLEANGFTSDDFALSHPGGSLGRKLLLKLSDIMFTGDQLPLVRPTETISDVLLEISQKGLGMAGIIDDKGKLLGIFTDGDLRRILDLKIDIHHTQVQTVMTKRSITGSPDMLAVEALNIMEDKKINSMFAIDNKGKPVGALNMHLLLRAGVV
ncbi:KpsF/GutQ family sugar-phosphate isomerase [Aestuariibacter sp. AA17]|uniref:Arabinose 5-phosphate isomerase n=1 Tax=Fluctibacter corallii TaxID=2984329 RepID=A0ABT3A4U0_9ALTE|nr:KpsF/GutQ family sugar-phosphate isomerase [Aestuariibacter sp. AA17]MCV2883655.1 KpsF/GutQ family sugar-phosphate isomerase [Aestuariibacter sp. AA17]